MKKRFIAGARCPQCQLEDKIFVYHKDGEDIAECNNCGYQSIRPKEGDAAAQDAPPDSPDGVVKIIH